ncbi:MAG: cyclic nucleotide-binding domain-containing protein [Thermoanaerobaculia bacterium]
MIDRPWHETLVDEVLELRRQGGHLARLSEAEVRQFVGDLEQVSCAKGETLIRFGETVDRVFILLQGILIASTTSDDESEKVVRQLAPGDLLGVGALLAGGTHSAVVRAAEECRLAALTRQGFDKLLERDSETWTKISELILGWMQESQLATYLNELFGPFAVDELDVLRDLEAEVELLTLEGGETLFRQEDPADAAYIVLSGRLRVVLETPGADERTLNELGRGEVLGEMALLTGEHRSATVYAVRDTDLARLSRKGFHGLIERRPESLRPLSHIIADRLRRHSHIHVPEHRRGSCTGLVPLDPSLNLEPFVRDLITHLEAHGSVALLTSAEVDRALGVPGIAQSSDRDPSYLRLSRWLHEREENYRFVLYLADPIWSPWTERCARQSDRCLYMADADERPEQGDIESRLEARWQGTRAPQRSLVLLHATGTARPMGTAGWLKARHVECVYHVRREHPGDLARLARIVGDRAVGVVFGGGGARGFAHLGVLRALEELGIPVDMIGGSSIGAPVAVPTAQGKSAEEALNSVAHHFQSLLDYTLPFAALLAGRRISSSIEKGAGAWDIEDLWLPYFCVSTNITTGRTVVHRRGSLLRAVRASVAIPGVLPPVPEGEDLLVDGGVLNNLPIDVMRQLNASGPVIAVDVLPLRGPRARADFGLSVSGWRLALSKITPGKRPIHVPSLGNTIMRSMFVGSEGARTQMLSQGLADLYLNIKASGVGLLEFAAVEKVAKIGYEASMPQLRQWLESDGLAGS